MGDKEATIYFGETMKNASAATKTILSSGSYRLADLYSITLPNGGATTYLTSFDSVLTAAIYPSGTQNTYLTGYTITRGATTQTVGVDSQELELTISPQFDSPGGPPLLSGYSILQAARLGLLDQAGVTFAKLYMSATASSSNTLDTSPGAVSWFVGSVADMDIDRFDVKLKIASGLLVLAQTQMPRNLFQAACVHTLYDSGCTLLKSSFTVSGSITGVFNNGKFDTNLTQADGYFDLGVIKFTSGANSGYQATVKTYLNAGGLLQLAIPFSAQVNIGDTFSIYPGCDHLQATCSTKFSNLAHFKATPYVPVVETLYDGGTVDTSSSQLGSNVGSGPASRIIP